MERRQYILRWVGRLVNIFFYLFLLMAAYIVAQVFIVTSFKIPSDSMSPSMWAGDCVLVDKCSGGARLFHLMDALENKEVKIHRMPGWRNFKRNDVLVFNFPYKEERWDSIAFDVMRYYVKRCVALPGDTLEIRNGYYRIRGLSGDIGNMNAQEQIANLPDSGTNVVMPSFPWSDKLKWTIKKFGPLPIPAKGQVVEMDSLAYTLYRQLIAWEQKRTLRLNEAGEVLLGDSIVHTYRFLENYYFMAGDNAYNSQDSRYWGMLPESFIVGRAVRIWKSVNPDTGEIRWNRVLKKIE